MSWKQKSVLPIKAEWIAALSFAIAIGVGSLLLWLPISSRSGAGSHPLTAFFTATSATCVTGLAVVDTGSFFSHFGQMVILTMIQLGGLGIMTLSTFMLLVVGRRLSIQSELVLMDALGSEKVRGLRALIKLSVVFTLTAEAIGTLIIGLRLISGHQYLPGRAFYHATFHAVSAFCNAGFSLYTDSLTQFRDDPVIMLTVCALVISGGLGFLVIFNLASCRPWRKQANRRGRLTLHTRLVLTSTAVLLVTGWFAFMVLEGHATRQTLPFSERATTALFQSMTPRTAGFNVTDTAELSPPSKLITMVMMLIGGSPGSTAGGLKTTTFVVLGMVVISMLRGRQDVEFGERSIPQHTVREAISICVLGISLVVVMYGALLLTESNLLQTKAEGMDENLLFETVSAVGTVGLSTGITPCLSGPGQLIIIICMFVGRLGPLTIALVIGKRALSQSVRYPEEEVVVG